MNRRTEFNFVNIPNTSTKKKSSSSKTKLVAKQEKPIEQKPVQQEVKKEPAVVAEVEVVEEPQEEIVADKVVELERVNLIDAPKAEPIKTAEVDHNINTPVILKTAAIKQPDVIVEEKEIINLIDAPKAEPIKTAEVDHNIDTPVILKTAAIKQPDVIVEEKEIIIPEIEETQVAEIKIETKEIIKEESEPEVEVAVVEKKEADKKEVKEAVIINYNSSIVATNPESNKVLNYIGTEKVKMIDQLSELEKKYEDAIPQYPKLADSLSSYKMKIAELITKATDMEETGWSNIIEYKNSVLHYKKRYRDLMVMNSRGSVSGNSTRADRQMAHASSAAPTQIKFKEQEIADLAVMEENLSVENVQITAMKMSGNGKYQKTNNANKTDLIKVSFKLLSNEKVNSGQKEAYIVLQNPEGDVEEAKGIFKIKDSETETKYTDHAIINYNNHDMDVTMFIQRRGNNYEKGVYPIKVFLEGELMAVTKLDLQNSY